MSIENEFSLENKFSIENEFSLVNGITTYEILQIFNKNI